MTTSDRPDRTAVSIIDVAHLAGVSRQTVSNVVNDRGGFSEETRSKVLRVIADTGYKPNRAARQLRTNQARHIGFPLHTGHVDPRNPFTMLFLKAVADALKPLEHSLIAFACGDHDEETFRSWARSGEIDGFVFDRVAPGDYRTAVCAELGIPFSVFGRTGADEAQSWVEVDNRSGMSSLVDYLVGRGRRRFAFLDHGGDQPWVTERIDAVRDRIAEHGLELPEAAIIRDSDYATLSARLDELLGQRERPDAIIGGSDVLALLIATRVREAGLRVGVDVGVTGFDGGMQGWLIDDTLTTVRIPAARVAEMLVNRLMALLDGGPPPERGLVIPTELVIGTSG
jgi:DNA-binding LacI/PurR family transcriptional regulator